MRFTAPLVCICALVGCADSLVGVYDGTVTSGDAKTPTSPVSRPVTLALKANHTFEEDQAPYKCEGNWTSDGKHVTLNTTRTYCSGTVIRTSVFSAPYELEISGRKLSLFETGDVYEFNKR